MSKEGPAAHDPRAPWLKSVQAEGTSPGTLKVGDKGYRYTIVRGGLAKGLPYAVGFPNDNDLFVSEDALEFDRPFVLAHEIREKTDFSSLPEEARCRASLEAELEDVRSTNPELYTDYLVRRRAFFEALVIFYQDPKQAAAVPDSFLAGIQASRDYLVDLLANK